MVDPSLLILVAVIVFGGIAVVVKAASNARAERMRETCFDFANTQGFTYYAQGYPNKIYDPGPFFGLFDSAPADPLLLQLQPFEPFTRGTN
ncbi:MAG: hypothetical protein HY248_02710, partial [Fimbriimonas ginsengisoli]|nr:hypothetical protein [Fimbriimonas ginsengisoli]